MTTKIKFANLVFYKSANVFNKVMYFLKSKQRFKKLSILLLVPYIILCITAGGFHAFDKSAFHGHSVEETHSEDIVLNADTSDNSAPIFCYNDHNEDDCIICKWLKHAPKRVQLSMDVSSSIPDTSGLCISRQQAYYFLNNRKYHSRAPPLFIS